MFLVHLWTWITPKEDTICQIDYITINQIVRIAVVQRETSQAPTNDQSYQSKTTGTKEDQSKAQPATQKNFSRTQVARKYTKAEI